MTDILIAIGSLLTAVFTGVLAWFAWTKRGHPRLQVDRWLINGKPELVGRPDEVCADRWNISFLISEVIGAPARLKEIRATANVGSDSSITSLPPQKFSSRIIAINAPYEAHFSVATFQPGDVMFLTVTLCFTDARVGLVGREIEFPAVIKANYAAGEELVIVRIKSDEVRKW